VLGHVVRPRSDENILAELDMAISKYGAKYINFADEIFLFNNERTKGLLRKFIEKGYPKKIQWSGLTRVNFVDEEIISLAKQAGCSRLEMGVESGNDQILRNTNKNITVAQIENAVRIIKKQKIKVASYYILGHPGETEATIKDTINLAAKLNTETIAVGIMVPYPGTKIYEWANEHKFGYKLLSKEWSRYDKYGGTALEIEGLPLEKLESYQRRAYLNFYLKNFRILDLIKFALSRYKGIFQVLFKK
jgi:anaerobic magnesium-protoporphyrin IX monomethyl ester cyclase